MDLLILNQYFDTLQQGNIITLIHHICTSIIISMYASIHLSISNNLYSSSLHLLILLSIVGQGGGKVVFLTDNKDFTTSIMQANAGH